MRGRTGDAMLEIASREEEVLDEPVGRGERAENKQCAQRQLARSRHFAKQNQCDREERHLHPQRVFTECVDLARRRERGDCRVDPVDREWKEKKMGRQAYLFFVNRPQERHHRKRNCGFRRRDPTGENEMAEIEEDCEDDRRRRLVRKRKASLQPRDHASSKASSTSMTGMSLTIG